jgi:TorA maturation chaperone TorD
MGPSTVKLANLYREYGFETSEIPDHICVELEFLAVLSTLFHDSSASGDTADTRLIADLTFVTGHLAAWTPEFFDRVVSWDEEGLYGSLARMCQDNL